MARKKAEAHHGGAWKVAYADFVTAMMALFMVLWICAQDKKILLATSHYFQSPFRSPLAANSGVMPYQKDSVTSQSGHSDDSSNASQASDKNKAISLSFLNSVAADFYRLLHLDENMDQAPIDVQVTSDGLRVTLFDRARKPIFSENGADFTPWGKFMMQNLAWMIDRHHFRVTIDGHTRKGLTLPKPEYTAWELSADRANAARRSLVYFAVDPALIERVTGYADTRPLSGQSSDSEANQRLTLSLTLVAREGGEHHVAGKEPAPSLKQAPRLALPPPPPPPPQPADQTDPLSPSAAP
jgi:chemotaxis protein MotB